MKSILIHYRSREVHEDDIVFIKTLKDNRYLRGRSYISREPCKSWNWVQPKGTLKEYAVRDLLLRLEEQELVALPPRIRPKNNLKPPAIRQPIGCMLGKPRGGECKTGQSVSVSWTDERTLPVFSSEKFPEVSCS